MTRRGTVSKCFMVALTIMSIWSTAAMNDRLERTTQMNVREWQLHSLG